MKAISVHVEESSYRELKALAARSRRPVAELIREAMADYVANRGRRHSLREIVPLPGGGRVRSWTRAEVADEMFEGASGRNAEGEEARS